MATSLLATGVSTEEAYRLASVVQAHLIASGRTDVTADELLTLTTDALLAEADGAVVARRWEAWRRAKRSGRPVVIVLGGASGVGKSTLATRLAVRLGITRVVTTDAIREVLRTVITSALAGHPAIPILVERLIVQRDVGVHDEFLRRRAIDEPLRNGHRHLDNLDRIRAIRDHLTAQAVAQGVTVIDTGEAGDLTQDIVDDIVDRLERTAV
jgi:2-phosphoglycerate kinase